MTTAFRLPTSRALDDLVADARCQPFGHKLVEAVRSLAATPPEQPINLSKLIRMAGLRHDVRGRQIYGVDAAWMLPRSSWTGRVSGPRTYGNATFDGIYHQPDQLACALDSLANKRIRSVIEVGVDGSWSAVFMSYLLGRAARTHGHSFAYHGVDMRDVRSPCVKALMDLSGMRFTRLTADELARRNYDRVIEWARALPSAQRDARRSSSNAADGHPQHRAVDLCFVDGDHTYRGVRADVERLSSHCTFVMLHDTLENIRGVGVPQQWAEMRRACPSSPAWTCEQGSVHRLGIAIQKQPCRASPGGLGH